MAPGQSLTPYGVGFYPHPYASTNLQVQRVSAIRAQSQLTSSAPLVGNTSYLTVRTISFYQTIGFFQQYIFISNRNQNKGLSVY